MRLWRRGAKVERSRRARRWDVEALEGRALLSTATTATQPAIPISSVPTDAPVTAANAAQLFPQATLAVVNNSSTSPAARAALTPQTQGESSPASTVGEAGQLAVTTAWDGYWLVHSTAVANVGLKYAKAAVSHDARKLGAAALGAIAKGNLTELNQLGKTRAAQTIKQDFTQLASSQPVQDVGSKFTDLGRSVTSQWAKMFG